MRETEISLGAGEYHRVDRSFMREAIDNAIGLAAWRRIMLRTAADPGPGFCRCRAELATMLSRWSVDDDLAKANAVGGKDVATPLVLRDRIWCEAASREGESRLERKITMAITYYAARPFVNA
jgi:hypothetical protein